VRQLASSGSMSVMAMLRHLSFSVAPPMRRLDIVRMVVSPSSSPCGLTHAEDRTKSNHPLTSVTLPLASADSKLEVPQGLRKDQCCADSPTRISTRIN
jgi:hypothetical protein